MDLHAIRQDYSRQELSEAQCLANPIKQFELWLNEAIAAQVNEPTAMNVATVGADNRPTNRVLLLKEVNPQGFVFFTNYASRKGQALAQLSKPQRPRAGGTSVCRAHLFLVRIGAAGARGGAGFQAA